MRVSKLIFLSIVVLFMFSCNKKAAKTEESSFVPPIALKFELSQNSIARGQSLDLIISSKDPKEHLAEDIKCNISFTGAAVSTSGEEIPSIKASDVFSDLPTQLTLKNGATSTSFTIHVNKDFSYKSASVSLSVVSRGYKYDPNTQQLTVYKNYLINTAVKGFAEGDKVALKSGKSVILAFSVPVAPVKDLKINISADNASSFKNLPASLIIKAGQKSVESNPIECVNDGKEDIVSKLSFSTDSDTYNLASTSQDINILAENKELVISNPLSDERAVYADPDVVFASSKYLSEAKKILGPSVSVKEMDKGEAHPNAALAKAGWTFYNSIEMTPIPDFIVGSKANSWGNKVIKFFGAQNVAGQQGVQAIDNSKYTDVNSAGQLIIWSAWDPGIHAKTWNNDLGERNAGDGAFYFSKNSNANYCRILPGMRVEIRAKCTGKMYGFNPALWFQGNKESVDPWAYYGEVDVLEAPQWANGSLGAPWQTFHWNTEKVNGKENRSKTSGEQHAVNINNWNIYWMEWRSNDEIAMGINGKELCTINRSDYPGHWPFDDIYNSNGMHLLVTMPAGVGWAGGNKDNWDKYLKNIPYKGSKTNPDTPRMEIDFIRFYVNSTYKDTSNPKAKDILMY